MPLVRPVRLTAEQFALLPDDDRRYELAHGEVVVMSPAGIPHGRIQMRLLLALGNFVAKNDLGEVFTGETGAVLRRDPDTVRAPDVWFVAGDRARRAHVFLEGAPDLVAEIVSPSNRARDVAEKVKDYLAAGVRLVWVLEPSTGTVAVYRPGGQHRLLGVGDTLSGEDVVAGFTLPVRELLAA